MNMSLRPHALAFVVLNRLLPGSSSGAGASSSNLAPFTVGQLL